MAERALPECWCGADRIGPEGGARLDIFCPRHDDERGGPVAVCTCGMRHVPSCVLYPPSDPNAPCPSCRKPFDEANPACVRVGHPAQSYTAEADQEEAILRFAPQEGSAEWWVQ